jgi:hypothetical protein
MRRSTAPRATESFLYLDHHSCVNLCLSGSALLLTSKSVRLQTKTVIWCNNHYYRSCLLAPQEMRYGPSLVRVCDVSDSVRQPLVSFVHQSVPRTPTRRGSLGSRTFHQAHILSPSPTQRRVRPRLRSRGRSSGSPRSPPSTARQQYASRNMSSSPPAMVDLAMLHQARRNLEVSTTVLLCFSAHSAHRIIRLSR